MTESIDVSNKSLEYISIFQSKSSSPELKIAEQKSKNSDGKISVAKNQIENYIKNSDSDTTKNDSLNYLKKINGDESSNIVYGSKEKDSEVIIGKKKKKDSEVLYYGAKDSDNSDVGLLNKEANYSIMNSYGALAAAVGANGRGVTKMDLVTYLQKLSSGSSKEANNAEVIAFLKNLIAQFDTLSGGEEYLTSLTGVKEPQDYSTVTKEQVTPPIDLRV